MKILVIAPHPDDEVLGCGGTIAAHKKRGDKVHLCIVTRAYTPDWSELFLKERQKEIKKSNAILGIAQTHFLNLPTVRLDTLPQKDLNRALGELVQKLRPDVVYLPHKGDLNRDHRLIFEAGLVAVRPLKHIVSRVLCYEILSETEWGDTLASFCPNVFVDIEAGFKKKLQAMAAYKSELRLYPHPRSLENIEALAQIRGSAAGMKRAEAFMLVREVVNK